MPEALRVKYIQHMNNKPVWKQKNSTTMWYMYFFHINSELWFDYMSCWQLQPDHSILLVCWGLQATPAPSQHIRVCRGLQSTLFQLSLIHDAWRPHPVILSRSSSRIWRGDVDFRVLGDERNNCLGIWVELYSNGCCRLWWCNRGECFLCHFVCKHWY